MTCRVGQRAQQQQHFAVCQQHGKKRPTHNRIMPSVSMASPTPSLPLRQQTCPHEALPWGGLCSHKLPNKLRAEIEEMERINRGVTTRCIFGKLTSNVGKV